MTVLVGEWVNLKAGIFLTCIHSLDLFSGAGGFALGFERAGIKTVLFCENNKYCKQILQTHWPNIPIINSIQELLHANKIPSVQLVCGGDPCPIRSRAGAIHQTKFPDLSGYFLAVVARCVPRWVVRENVVAPDDKDFYTALEMLGYRCVIIATNATKVTAQNRERDFIVGCSEEEKFSQFLSVLPVNESDQRYFETKHEEIPTYPVLTTRPMRWDHRDGYIWDGRGIRVANREEREILAGFPVGWFNKVSKTQMVRMTGNAVVPRIIEVIGKVIVTAENQVDE